MKKKYMTLIFLLFCFVNSYPQTKKFFIQKTNNPFVMVHVNDSLKTKLYNFLLKEGYSTENSGLYIYHLLDEDKKHNYEFVEGGYSFRLMGPHFPLYYFFYTKKDGIQIIENYTVEGLLSQLIEIFKRNEAIFDEQKKITYVEVMIHNLDHRDDVYGDSEILKNRKKKR